MYLLRTIFWYFHFILSLALLTPKMIWLERNRNNLPRNDYIRRVEEIARKWALSQVKFSGARFHVKGEENIPKDKAVLYVSNHQGDFDIPAFICFLPKPKGFVAKVEMLKAPLLRTWMNLIDCVFIDRNDIRKSAKAINEAVEILKSGYSMVVFPEGTRSKCRSMGEFKPGSFKMATKSKAPIVPVTIDGAYKVMEANNYFIKPADIYVTVHPPVYTEGISIEETVELPEKVKNIIKSAL